MCSDERPPSLCGMAFIYDPPLLTSLQMYDTVSKWLFDACLFEKYPELKYPGHESLVARGKSFRRSARKVGPTKMSSWTTNFYHKVILGRDTVHVDITV